MSVSLVITTYNWKDALALVLQSALHQTRLPDEIVIADDGSNDGTDQMVANIAVNAPVPILHSWQEDNGFRVAMCRNKAIAKASGEYIILIDGDIVMERHFVEDHLSMARKGYFVQGTRVLLSEQKTNVLLNRRGDIISFWDKGIGNRKNCLRSPLFAKMFSWESAGIKGIKTCNFACWKEDAVNINGFDEDFVGWGREDSDFAARLLRYGVCRRTLRFCAIAYHLYHQVQSRVSLGQNDALLGETLQAVNKVQCGNGIDKYL